MEKVQRIPLSQRLQNIRNDQANFLSAFELFVDDYFKALSEICGNDYFEKIYDNQISQYNFKNGWCSVLSEIAYLSDDLPQEEATKLLYSILIEPFALILM